MAGLPQVMKVKMESLRAAEAAGAPAVVPVKPNGATAVVSMVPNGERPRPPGTTAPAPAAIDPNDFAVDPQPAVSGAPPAAAATVPDPVSLEPVTPAPRAGDEELPKPKEGSPEYPYWLRWKTVAGMFERSKDDRRKLQENLDSLTTRFDALAAKLDQVTAAPPPPPPAPTPVATIPLDSDLTDEQRRVYADALPVIEKMAGRIVAQALEAAGVPALKTEVSSLKENTGKLANTQLTQDENAFISRVRDRFPKMDSMVKEAGWTEYMQRRVPFSPHTFGQALIAAHNARDFERVAEIFEGYQPTPKPTIDDLATPSRRADTIDPVATAQRKPTLKWSERVKASVEFRKGRLSKERMEQIDALYAEAEREGRINMNA